MIYALLCDPGPGDALRFFHALCEMALEQKKKIVLFCLAAGYQRTNTLLEHLVPFHFPDQSRDDGYIRRGAIDIHIAEDIAALNGQLRKYAHGEVYHCFETEYFQKCKKVLLEIVTQGVDAEFILLDRYQEQYYIRNCIMDHLIVEPHAPWKEDFGLLFVRLNSIMPERNLSCELFREILELGRTFGIRWKIAGSFLSEEYFSILEQYEESEVLYKDHRYPDYYQQICDYSQYRLAVGMNSGALDLAAAAGLPIIRIGEYHQCLPYHGLHYNDFLAGGRTVNILSNSERDISNITAASIRRAFDILLQSEECGIYYE